MTALSKTDQGAGAAGTDAEDATGAAGTAKTADPADAPAADEAAYDDTAEAADGAAPGEHDGDADDDEPGELPPAARASTGVAAGAAAIVGAALGLASLTGTWLADLVSARRELTGQLESANGTAAEQISAAYGTPWHTIALFNGLTAVVALIVSAAVLVRPAFGDSGLRPVVWVRAVAVAGLVLGLLGLVIAAVMRFDVFADLPTVPGQ
ncbi:hypothetical protein [Streptomyces sp. CMB-StM0423]|uniref:hypothetical protein n=1 Tax=Streptomyces sp. CMB-StM0423 TaxID=2059884 RepID=UPI000C705580|nr:hypothetical protein [Streptomyces sp. CMB-StM0423]AUH40319.1 hypothetical protein CXR04_08730 [Streptomyces sp. CMB-StM0423]